VDLLSVADRALIPDVLPTADALFDRVVMLGSALLNLDRDVDMNNVRLLDERIAAAERDFLSGRPDERKLSLLRKQRVSLQGLVDSHLEMKSQFESAALMLRNLALDVLKLRSAGVQSVMSDVNSATQEARALVREISHVLGAADELRAMESKSRRE
jgi:serine/threonine-protein kinase